MKPTRPEPQDQILDTLLWEVAARNISSNPNGTINVRLFQVMAYADDIATISRNKWSLHSTTQELIQGSERVGLEINCSKTEYMRTSRRNCLLDG